MASLTCEKLSRVHHKLSLEISLPEQNTYPETPEHGTTSPHDSASHFADPDPIPCCDIQDNTDMPVEPPAFRGDSAENTL